MKNRVLLVRLGKMMVKDGWISKKAKLTWSMRTDGCLSWTVVLNHQVLSFVHPAIHPDLLILLHSFISKCVCQSNTHGFCRRQVLLRTTLLDGECGLHRPNCRWCKKSSSHWFWCTRQRPFFQLSNTFCFCVSLPVRWRTRPVAGGGAAGSAEEAERSGGWAGQILGVAEGCPGEAGASREKSNRCEWRELVPGVTLLQRGNYIKTTLTYCTQPSHIWSLHSNTGVMLLTAYALILTCFIYHCSNCFNRVL